MNYIKYENHVMCNVAVVECNGFSRFKVPDFFNVEKIEIVGLKAIIQTYRCFGPLCYGVDFFRILCVVRISFLMNISPYF